MKAIQVDFRIQTDDKSALDVLDDLNSRIERTRKALVDAQKQGGIKAIVAQADLERVLQAQQGITSLTAKYGDLTKALQKTEGEDGGMAAKAKEVAVLRGEIEDLSASIEKIPAVRQGTGDKSDSLRESGQSLSAIAGLAGNLGGQNVGNAAQIGAGVLQAVDSLKGLSDTLTRLPGIIGNVASSGASLLAPLGGMAAEMGAVLAVVAPVAIVLAAFALGMAALDASLKGAKQSLDAALQAEDNYYKAVAEMTTEQVETQKATLEKALPALQAQAGELQGGIDAVWKQAVAQFGDAGARALQAAGKLPIGDLQTKLDDVNKQIQANIDTTTRYSQGLSINAFAANDAAAAEADLAAKRQQAIATVESLEGQRTSIIQNNADQVAQIEENRGINATREEQDFNRNRTRARLAQDAVEAQIETQGQDRILQIRTQGMQRVAQIDKQIGKLNENLAAAELDLIKRKATLASEFMASELEAIRKEKEDEQKIDKEYNKQRAKLLSDLSDNLLDAEANNDVNAFIQAENAGKKQLDELAQNHDDQSQERQKAFDDEREQAQVQFQARLQDLQEQADARKQDIQDQISEQKAARAETIQSIKDQQQAEQDRIIAAKKASDQTFQDRIAQEDTDRKIRNDRLKADQDLEDSRRKAQNDKQLANIQTQETAALNSAQLIGNSFSSMASNVGSIVSGVIARIRSSATSSSYSGGSGGSSSGSSSGYGFSGTIHATAFANEGMVNRPTIGLLGEKLLPGQMEGVFKFKPSEGLPPGMSGQGGINLSIGTLTIGSDMGRTEVEDAIRDGLYGVLDGLQLAKRSSK